MLSTEGGVMAKKPIILSSEISPAPALVRGRYERASSGSVSTEGMQMKTESIEYQDGDLVLRGFLAYDDTQSGRRPGVLVMPGGFGLGANAKSRAEKLARLGYVALAGDPMVRNRS
jgi:hypothetical protein